MNVLMLFSVFQTIPIVHLEDVYITGLCASSCHLRREHDKGFKARPMDKISEYKLQVIENSIHSMPNRF